MSSISRDIFKEKLSLYMKKANMNQSQLAKDLGVSKATVSCWLSGKTFPRIDTVQNIADCLNCTVGQLTVSHTKPFPYIKKSDVKRTIPIHPVPFQQVVSSNTNLLSSDIAAFDTDIGIKPGDTSSVKKAILSDKSFKRTCFEASIREKTNDDIFGVSGMTAEVKRDTSEIIKMLVQMPDDQRHQAIRAVKRVSKRGTLRKKG